MTRLIEIYVDELPPSCWSCRFNYNDDFGYRCALLDKSDFKHVNVDEYKKERHPDCPLKVSRLD